MDREQVKRGLRQLPAAQLAEMKRYLDGLLALPGGRTPVQSKPASWILQVLDRECEGLAIGRASSSERARRAINKVAPELEAYFARAMPGSPLIHKRLVLATGVRLVYARMTAAGLAATPALLATNISAVPACLDRAYPGYARLGVLGHIVNAGELAKTAPAAGRRRELPHAALLKSQIRQTRKSARIA